MCPSSPTAAHILHGDSPEALTPRPAKLSSPAITDRSKKCPANSARACAKASALRLKPPAAEVGESPKNRHLKSERKAQTHPRLSDPLPRRSPPSIPRPQTHGRSRHGTAALRGLLRHTRSRIEFHRRPGEAHRRQHALALHRLSHQRRRKARPLPRPRIRNDGLDAARRSNEGLGTRLVDRLRNRRFAHARRRDEECPHPRRSAYRRAGTQSRPRSLRPAHRTDRLPGQAPALQRMEDIEHPARQVRGVQESSAKIKQGTASLKSMTVSE